MAGTRRPAKIASAKSATQAVARTPKQVAADSRDAGLGVIGRKIGMTQVFQDDGTMIAVSVLSVEPNVVTRLRTVDQDGYTALQLGTDNATKLSKPETGQFKALAKGVLPATVHEFRLDNVDAYQVGQTLDVSLFAAGELVDVTGVSKGKGF